MKSPGSSGPGRKALFGAGSSPKGSLASRWDHDALQEILLFQRENE